jgi:hypothetical protein
MTIEDEPFENEEQKRHVVASEPESVRGARALAAFFLRYARDDIYVIFAPLFGLWLAACPTTMFANEQGKMPLVSCALIAPAIMNRDPLYRHFQCWRQLPSELRQPERAPYLSVLS